jgi:hypothetical protein
MEASTSPSPDSIHSELTPNSYEISLAKKSGKSGDMIPIYFIRMLSPD